VEVELGGGPVQGKVADHGLVGVGIGGRGWRGGAVDGLVVGGGVAFELFGFALVIGFVEVLVDVVVAEDFQVGHTRQKVAVHVEDPEPGREGNGRG